MKKREQWEADPSKMQIKKRFPLSSRRKKPRPVRTNGGKEGMVEDGVELHVNGCPLTLWVVMQ